MHTELDHRNITIQTRLFKIFGIWPQTDIHTHACAQCSHTSVELAQARPNYQFEIDIPYSGKIWRALNLAKWREKVVF